MSKRLSAGVAIEVQVTRKHHETRDICSFELVDPQGRELPAFSPGAHIDVRTPSGLLRQYSLCNHSGERHRYQIAVLREPTSRGGSASMHDAVFEGSRLRITAPRNHFPLAADAEHTILLAGGIGITPILCMAERLVHDRATFEMHYCARSRDLAAWVPRLESSSFAASVSFYFDDASDGRRLQLEKALDRPSPRSHLYVCGPTGFLSHVRDHARALGWSDSHVHHESFRPTEQQASGTPNRGFDVKLARSGRLVHVTAAQTIVEALAGEGIDVPVSCGVGVCGTCLTRVLEGEPDHRDNLLSDEEHARNDLMALCCSRARSQILVLDL